MKQLFLFAGIALISAPAWSSPQALPIKGVRHAEYRLATGELIPTAGGSTRFGPVVWSSSNELDSYFSSFDQGWTVLDWGDLGTPGGDLYIDGFQFAYVTDYEQPNTFTAIIWFYAEENGFNTAGKERLAGFAISELPGMDPVTGYNGWIITVDLEETIFEFLIDGSDLDDDGLVDFGYSYWFDELPAGSVTGPFISGVANDPLAPGQEDVFDAYTDPNVPNISYAGTYNFGGDPFAQFWLELYEENNAAQPCPNPGASGNFCTADIDGSGDCIVGLADLAALLGSYLLCPGDAGYLSRANLQENDPPDGCVDLADLAVLLGQYTDDCR